MTMNILLLRGRSRLSRLWQTYLGFVERHPAKAHAANTGVLMATGDVISQFVLERKTLGDYDVIRTARFAFVGAVLAGPCMHVWYSALDRWVKFSSHTYRVIAKTTADQAFFLPVYLGGFVVVMGALRGDKSDKIRRKIARDFKPMLVASYGIWPAVQLLNFYLLPLQHRILLINLVSLFWNSYISWKGEKKLICKVLPK